MSVLHFDQGCRCAHALLGRRLMEQLNTLRSRKDALKASIAANQTALAKLGDRFARPASLPTALFRAHTGVASSGIPSVPAFVNPYKPTSQRITPPDAPSTPSVPAFLHPYKPNADRVKSAPSPDGVTPPPSARALLSATADDVPAKIPVVPGTARMPVVPRTRLTPVSSAPTSALSAPALARRASLHILPNNGMHSSLVKLAYPHRITSTKVPTP